MPIENLVTSILEYSALYNDCRKTVIPVLDSGGQFLHSRTRNRIWKVCNTGEMNLKVIEGRRKIVICY